MTRANIFPRLHRLLARWSVGMCMLVFAASCQRPAPGPPALSESPTEQNPLGATAFEEPPPAEPEPEPFIHDKSSQVSILLYHEFSGSGQATDMIIPTDHFRTHMVRIKESGTPVISLDDFLAWRRGERNIPSHCFMITMDDGWKSVYTDAFPILRELGFPFTIFLYSNYIASGSRSLSVAQIKEMLANGATVGCHSRSHPYPATVKAARSRGPEAFDEFLTKEMVGSADRIKELIGTRPIVYAYPGGYYAEDMFPTADAAGYQALFTVNPGKTTWETPIRELPRYVIHGNAPSTFANASTFAGVPLGRRLLGPDNKELSLNVAPPDGSTVTDRHPVLSADLSPIADLDPESIVLRVSGLGTVNHQFDPVTKRLTYQPESRLRAPEVSMYLFWKRVGEDQYDAPMTWKFQIDARTWLLDSIPPPPAGAKSPPPLPSGSPAAPPLPSPSTVAH